MNIYREAARRNIRFPSTAGVLTVEDLWTLPLTSRNSLNLDTIAKTVNRQLKDSEQDESFVTESSTSSDTRRLRIAMDILLDIIEAKKEQLEISKKRIAAHAKRQRIMELIARKEDEKLADNSIAELKRMLEEEAEEETNGLDT